LASSLRQAQALHVLIDQLNAMTRTPKPIGPATEGTTSKNEAFTEKQEPEISGLWERIDQQLQQSANISSIATEELGNSVRNCVNKGLQQMATVITAGTKGTEAGVMVVNTSLVSRRHHWTAPQGIAAAESTQSLYAQLPVGSTVRTVLDMPPCGYFWSAQSDPSQSPRGRLPRSANLASADATLGNEFMEVQIDRATGHLKALHVPKKRGNRISSQLSMFDPRGAGTSEKPYSVMKATQVTMGQSSPVYGEVSAIGGLWFEREKVAEFQIAYQLWRGSRVLYLHIDLDVKRKLLDDPWASYLALRTAFASDSAVLFGTVGGSRQTLPRGRFISPSYVEIDEVDHRTTLLLGGLAYHRRYSERFLDSLLVVKGESASSFKIGIGVDLPEPTIAAETFLEQPLKMDGVPGLPRSGAVNWFFVAEPPQALVQLQSTLVDEAGQIRGVRLFVREVAGKLTSSRIRCLRDVGEAYRSDYQGKSLGKLTVEQDAVLITLSANEQCLVDIIWQTNSSVA
jgi:alpha-mannosidase